MQKHFLIRVPTSFNHQIMVLSSHNHDAKLRKINLTFHQTEDFPVYSLISDLSVQTYVKMIFTLYQMTDF